MLYTDILVAYVETFAFSKSYLCMNVLLDYYVTPGHCKTEEVL